ncbi:hypothetical protein LTR56_006216 [Elasticomyces elasticus]|nr:hypothetical protein LTR56_006216 [Elasticomyces elasticus]KAK3666575.1 hypothetical protein LTR22_002519 [Elasticomyces elasticus]KAK4928292.1 hypothetical protein LTR49_004969 [Elasticomyces elasticus]KAK5763855.1 hypothetical protein LTS12_005973 [Elasticomyces elasticus]
MKTPENMQQDLGLLPGGMAVSTRKSMIVRLILPAAANVQMRDNSSRDDAGVEIETSIAPRARAPRVAVERGTPRRSGRRHPPPGAFREPSFDLSDSVLSLQDSELSRLRADRELDSGEDSDEDEVTSCLPKRNSNTGNEAKSKRSRSTIGGKGAYLQHHNLDVDDEELPLVKHEDAQQSEVRSAEDVKAGNLARHGGTDGPTVHGAAANFIGNADVQGPPPPPQPSQTQQEPFQAGAGAHHTEDSDDDEALKLRLDIAELRLKLHLAGRKRKRGD